MKLPVTPTEPDGIQIAMTMRGMMSEPVGEVDKRCNAYRFNRELGTDGLLAAWRHLESYERSRWKKLVDAGERELLRMSR